MSRKKGKDVKEPMWVFFTGVSLAIYPRRDQFLALAVLNHDGTGSLATGSIARHSSLSSRPGCVPLNLFGILV